MKAMIAIMRKRVDDVGASNVIRQSGASRITVELADSLSPREPVIAKSAQLLFYDWEPNVIGASGKPALSEETATGGPQAGAAQFGLPEYLAVRRAEKRAPIPRANDTTWSKGCTPAQVAGCTYGNWYLLDPHHEKVLAGPEETREGLYAHGNAPRATTRAVRVNPGTVLVQARPLESASGKVINSSPNSYYVLNDNSAMTGADITEPRQGVEDEGDGTKLPVVTFGFTTHGESVFDRLTKEIALRGQESQLPGVSKEAAEQHFAVVLDGQLVTTPSIDYTKYPEGIDASTGSQISGGFTVSSARELAAVLGSGPLPLRLVLVFHAQR
jgi:preprotein translocase subunit SecD